MKGLKLLALIGLLVLLLIGFGVALLTRPGVQKTLLLNYLERTGAEASIEHFEVGWNTIEINRFYISQNEIAIDLGRFKGELFPLSLLYEDEIVITNASLSDLIVTLPSDLQPASGAVDLPEVNSSADLDSKYTFGELQGDFILKRNSETDELTSLQPVQLKKVFIISEGLSLLNDVEINTNPTIFIHPDRVEIDLNELSVNSQGSSMISGEGRIGVRYDSEQLSVEVSGNLIGHLPTLIEQPLFSDYGNIKDGQFSFIGEIEFDQHWSADFTTEWRDLKLHDDPAIITHASFEVNAQLNRDGTIDFKLPIIVEGSGGRSEVEIQLSYQQLENKHHLKASLKGNQLNLTDLLFFQKSYLPRNRPLIESSRSLPSMMATRDPLPASPHSIQQPRDALAHMKPFWTDCVVNADIKLDKINVRDDISIDKIVGRAYINRDRVVIEAINAEIYNSPFQFDGTLNYNHNNSKPYQLESRVKLTDFDTGTFFKKIEPERRPVVEAVVDITSNFSGHGQNLYDLWSQIRGQINLESEKGVFRALEAAGENVSTGATLLNIVGALVGEKVRELHTANRLTAFLRNIYFDSFSIEATRDGDLNFRLNEFIVKSPDIHFTGNGHVFFKEGFAIFDQPLFITTQFSAKNEVAGLLQDLALLKNQQDEQGYFLGPSFSIRGNLSRPDFSDLNHIIFQAGKNIFFPDPPHSN